MTGWLKAFLDSTDPTASLRHAAYALVVGCGCGWLTWWMFRPGPDANWVAAFAALLAAVTTGKVMGAKKQTPGGGEA
jgi:Na+-translocating ferredoxin:NAD+ oxidoreductase RnfD subunit